MVRPCRGDRYGIEKPFGLSILVLGESSYDCEDNPDGLLPEEWSESIIGHVFRNQRDNTITRAACVFSGGLRNFEWRQDFWRTAAFTNYVQHSAGSGPRQRPSVDKWEYGRPAFQQALEELQPQFVLALGKELWHFAFRRNELPGNVVSIGIETRPFCLRKHVGGSSFVFGITHPAYPRGWKYTEWSPWVNAAMEKAMQLNENAKDGDKPANGLME